MKIEVFYALSFAVVTSDCSRQPGETNVSIERGALADEEILSQFPGAIAGEVREVRADQSPGAVVASIPPSAEARSEHSADDFAAESTTQREAGPIAAVVGANGDAVKSWQYKVVLKPQYGNFDPKLQSKDPASAASTPIESKVAPSLKATMNSVAPGARIPVIVTLAAKFATSLGAKQSIDEMSSFAYDATTSARRAQRSLDIAARKEEATSGQASIRAWLASRNISVSSEPIWIVNAVVADLPVETIEELSQQAAVRQIALNFKLSTANVTEWDGENVRLSSGLNASSYLNNSYTGWISNPNFSLPRLRVAVLDFFFNDTHPIFRDGPGTWSRVTETWNCSVNPCIAGLPIPAPTDQLHGSWCASAVAGDGLDLQISGTFAERLDRSGVAEEPEIIMISTGLISDTIRGLERAVASHADIVSESFAGADGVCDGDYAAWDEAVYQAEQSGVLVVGAAGNERTGHPAGQCELVGPGEVPSILTVGALNNPGSGPYSTVDMAPYSSEGGVNVTINGAGFSRAFTGVDLVVPGSWAYAADRGTSFVSVGGTSLATPQVAGAAILFKHWAISSGFGGAANLPGWMFANMLAMTDRTSSLATKAGNGFSPLWGGGRFQMRYYSPADNTSGPWRYETAWYSLFSSGQYIDHHVGGVGPEPVGIQQFKAYALVLENDGINVADVDLRLMDNDCGSGASTLQADYSRDYKSMVSLGPAAAGKALCIRINSYYMPPGESRLVQLVVYYSTDTAMR